MPSSLTYPGVYIEEIPSGVRTITGVATSITAFVGRAARGPADADTESPVIINSYGDFERNFGSLDPAYPMGYAVRDFYLNGGAQAAIVRLYKGTDGKPAKAVVAIANLPLEAATAGSWGNQLRVRVDSNVSPDIATSFGLAVGDLFNLTVRDMASGTQESFLNLSVKESPRRVDRVLKAGSALLRVAAAPALTDSVPTAHAAAPAGKTVWDDDTSSTGVAAPAGQAVDSAALDDNTYLGNADAKTGIYALKKTDLFNLLCIPPDLRGGNTSKPVYQNAMALCVERRALLIVDAPTEWGSAGAITPAVLAALGLTGIAARNAALYFPRVIESDPKRQGQLDTFVPCGIVAGVMARTDTQRGVWKAPAGIDAALNGVQGLAATLNDAENGMLNPLGVNCLRSFPLVGPVAWGSRTLRGADLLADEYKYVPVRRLALYIEESLFRGTQWVVFEPNDEPLWSQIRLNVGAFMQNLFRQGAFQGKTPNDAYFVKCDKETTTQNDINLGIVNIVVGFAPLKPAEFVVIQLQQMAGQIQT
ncbi:phage tail protein [Rhodanobacter sp. Soil772]|uniref:phage tail sheath family protein n=1 Tax=Rhodanobacter sp. Soil772 TaxID=1736406 RepID=UPI0006FDD85F|nr:phage tail sheath C-terminal domain-containing protein [Rhodanobacter sp. Soil772]KRE82940.1 phage tail protein [Rhodanobacter sp. Soil772]